MVQVETVSFLAWNKFEKKKFPTPKGKGQAKKVGRQRFSAGIKPKLSLDERKKALQALKAKSKCLDCGEIGHWAGDDGCKRPKRRTGNMALEEDVPSDTGALTCMLCDDRQCNTAIHRQ